MIDGRTDTRVVTVMVLAQRCPQVLEALSRACDVPGLRMLVHLDAKESLDGYASGRSFPDGLEFIDERHEVFWGGFSMIRATEALARRALEDSSCEACVLVSDDTLPLVPAVRIRRELLDRPDRIDVGLTRRNPPYLRRWTEFFFLDSPMTSARPIATELRAADAASLEAMRRLERLRARGKHPFTEVWGGSQWWSLGRDSLRACLDGLSDEWVRESFEFSAVPDELAFQTLHANRLGLSARSFTGPMLTDMGREPMPFVFRRAEELPSQREGKLFVRKVAPEAGESMMAEIRATWEAGGHA